MRFFKLKIISVLLLSLVILPFTSCTHEVKSKSLTDDKCYKINKMILPWSPKGFDIDSQGNIYINFTQGINVYDSSGVFKYALKVKSYGVFEIKIDRGDLLNVALAREDEIRVYNKEGYVIQEEEDHDGLLYAEYQKNNRTKTDSKGNKYVLSNLFGYTKLEKITSDGLHNTIYKIPLLVWTFKLLLTGTIIFIVLVAILVFERYISIIEKAN